MNIEIIEEVLKYSHVDKISDAQFMAINEIFSDSDLNFKYLRGNINAINGDVMLPFEMNADIIKAKAVRFP